MSELLDTDVPAGLPPTTYQPPVDGDGTGGEYTPFLTDLGVGIVLAIMVFSCVGCICSCFLYNTFRQWQARVVAERRRDHMESGYDTASLPSYTVVGGLPSYEEAIEQLTRGAQQMTDGTPSDTPVPILSRLSVGDLLDIYKKDVKKTST